MTDMDFDELDKAVNSLMNEANKTEVLDEEENTISATELNQTSAQPLTNLTTKRATGRFMDVMPPSSVKHRSPQPAVSRVGATVGSEPSETDGGTHSENQEPLMKAEGSAVQSSVDDQNDATFIAPQSDDDVDEVRDYEERIEENLDEQISGSDQDKNNENDYSSLLESPFISGATVAKRPLGVATEPASSEKLEDELKVDKLGNDQPSPDILVPEYSKEVLELESKELTYSDTSLELRNDELEQTQVDDNEVISEVGNSNRADFTGENIDLSENQNKETAVDIENVPEVAPVSAVTPSGGDIPQQWSPVVDESEPVPMFDAVSDQVQQLTPTKKKSGWVIFLVIVLFLVLGVVGGVVVYFFLLQ